MKEGRPPPPPPAAPLLLLRPRLPAGNDNTAVNALVLPLHASIPANENNVTTNDDGDCIVNGTREGRGSGLPSPTELHGGGRGGDAH